MRKVIKTSARAAAIAAVALVLHTPRATHADMIVGNLDQSTANNSSSVKFDTQTLAQQFNTGGQGVLLTSVQALLGNYVGPATGSAELVTDNAGAPGTQVVANFTFPTVPAVNPGSVVQFNPTAGPVTLAAHTNYWFVLGATSGTGFYEWSYASNQNLTTGSVGTLGPFDASVDNGSTWTAQGSTRGLIEVNGTSTPAAVPEPSSLALIGLGGVICLKAWLRGRRRDQTSS